MIINLTIHGQHLFPVRREQRLSTTLRVNDTQSLVGENGAAATIDTTPVWSAMADLLTHLQCLLTELMRLLLDV